MTASMVHLQYSQYGPRNRTPTSATPGARNTQPLIRPNQLLGAL
jgi:hypothetical protein